MLRFAETEWRQTATQPTQSINWLDKMKKKMNSPRWITESRACSSGTVSASCELMEICSFNGEGRRQEKLIGRRERKGGVGSWGKTQLVHRVAQTCGPWRPDCLIGLGVWAQGRASPLGRSHTFPERNGPRTHAAIFSLSATLRPPRATMLYAYYADTAASVALSCSFRTWVRDYFHHLLHFFRKKKSRVKSLFSSFF